MTKKAKQLHDPITHLLMPETEKKLQDKILSVVSSFLTREVSDFHVPVEIYANFLDGLMKVFIETISADEMLKCAYETQVSARSKQAIKRVRRLHTLQEAVEKALVDIKGLQESTLVSSAIVVVALDTIKHNLQTAYDKKETGETR